MEKNRKFIQLSTILKEKEINDCKIIFKSYNTEELERIRLSALMNRDYHSYSYHLRENYTYTRLIKDNHTWMSDTPMETFTNLEFLRHANGDVLVFGLGLGYILWPLVNDTDVKSLTVVEEDVNVISIMKEFTKDKMTVIEGDAFEVDFGKRKFDTIYFDIWRDRCADNYEDMKILHKKYRKNYNIKNPDRWINSWLKDWCKKESRY